MTAQDPFENFLSQLNELMQLADLKRKQGKPSEKLPEDINQRLMELEASTELLREITEKTLKNANIPEEKVQEALTSTNQLPAKERHLLERSKKMQTEVDAIKKELSKEVVIAKHHEKLVGKKGKTVQTRKKKFRPMGGHKDWKPL